MTHPHTLIEWRMQKLDDYRLDLDQMIRQFLHLKKHLLSGRSQQAFALKPTNQIYHFKQRFTTCARSLRAQMSQRIAQDRQRLAYKRQQLDHIWQTQQTQRRHTFNQVYLIQELQQLISDRLAFYRQKLTHIFDLLKALDPQNVLEKGYSILFAEGDNKVVISSIEKLRKGQQARLLLSDGEVLVTITEIRSRHHEFLSGE